MQCLPSFEGEPSVLSSVKSALLAPVYGGLLLSGVLAVVMVSRPMLRRRLFRKERALAADVGSGSAEPDQLQTGRVAKPVGSSARRSCESLDSSSLFASFMSSSNAPKPTLMAPVGNIAGGGVVIDDVSILSLRPTEEVSLLSHNQFQFCCKSLQTGGFSTCRRH